MTQIKSTRGKLTDSQMHELEQATGLRREQIADADIEIIWRYAAVPQLRFTGKIDITRAQAVNILDGTD